MEKKKIVLSTQEQLRIFMSPQRQKVLRIMNLSGNPMTAKEVADQMELSASSAQLHIRKLIQLGVVEKDHTANIRGITATYYRLVNADVNIGLQKDDELSQERDVVTQNLLMRVYENGRDTVRLASDRPDLKPDEFRSRYGDIRSGVVHLKPKDVERLQNFINTFLEDTQTPSEDTVPWEFAYIIYNTKAGGEKNGK